ncbi:hypothetical protein ABID22_004085 [Pontibacter aydingkolensis]|uniref:DUF5602 domain-containing protein n=1 Tax=Pontibacter aydingkolensis TaxID=1911536 RepID=A0ABS7CZS2_9BACT|nr:DUF5602 domain-containing protein [Pontibacter aydingkolensis]MBW7469325.1 DUF5602 domain-containing protein [Pontibacter aydingkolensis]
MKKNNFSGFYKVLAFLAFTSVISLTSCERHDDATPNVMGASTATELRTSTTHTQFGPAIPFGRGVARSWIQTTKSGEPLAIGINISAKATASLPDEMMVYTLALPKNSAFDPFKSVMLDWNPEGHAPDGVYTLPHFDMHFYLIAEEERMMIAPGPQTVFPESQYLPQNFVTDGFAVPMMGAHWINLLAPEWNGQKFTHTFIYGSYLEDVIFYEPMITLEFLQGLAPGQTVTAQIPQPSQVQKSGYYPTHYTITYDPTPREYIIALTGLRFRQAQ